MTCWRCGESLKPDAVYCSRCAAPVTRPAGSYEEGSACSRMIALLLCVFLGYLGIHRFYVGRIGTGILWFLTGGLLGIGYAIDIILIAVGRFRDAEGLPLIYWEAPEH